VDGATVFIDGAKRPSTWQNGKWIGPLDPGDYKVRIKLYGYDDVPEQTVTLTAGKTKSIKFALTPTVVVAFLKIDGGTPDADVFLDGKRLGTLDSAGSLPQQTVAPGEDHSIRIEKENYEPLVIKRQAAAKETIAITGAEAQLNPYGTLVFDIQTPEAKVTIRLAGEAPREVTDKTLRLRAGTYTVNASAAGYERLERDEQANPGKSRTVVIKLSPVKKTAPTPPKSVELSDLFGDSKNWTRQGGFWIYDGTNWLNEIYFTHVFDILRPKKGIIKSGKVSWRIYLQGHDGNDYIECQLDDSAFYRREKIGGKFGHQTKILHNVTGGDSIRVEITVAKDHVTHKIGQVNDNFACSVGGHTGFDGKFGLRLAN